MRNPFEAAVFGPAIRVIVFRRAGPLVDFAKRYHQSLNWLILGDVGSMCHMLAFKEGWRPAWWDKNFEATAVKMKALKTPKRIAA